MSVYVGIDVHRKRSQVAVVGEDGKVQLNRNVVSGQEPMLRLIGGLPAGTPVAFEAAYGWGWLVELLEDYGFDPHLVHPLRCKAIASARLKNDKVDAAILAQLLRADLLPEAWIAPLPVRQLRALLRHRASLVRLGTQLRNRIHAVAADYGYDRPASYWTGPGRGWLADLDLPPVSRAIVTDCLAAIDALAPVIDRLDGEVHLRQPRTGEHQHPSAQPPERIVLAPDHVSPLVGIQLVRLRRCAAAGAPAAPLRRGDMTGSCEEDPEQQSRPARHTSTKVTGSNSHALLTSVAPMGAATRSIARADIDSGHAEGNGPRRVTRMPQDHANCAGPGGEAAIDRALKPEIYRVLGIAVKEIAVLEDGRLVEERCCGAVGEVKVNFDPSRYRCVGYPTHCGRTHSTHNSSMRITAPVRTRSSAALRRFSTR
jgi:Transposase